jgi:predicted GNAT family N-acyltransferase
MPSVDLSHLHLGQVSVERIIPLRHRMLRQNLPLDSAWFPGDDSPATIHFAAIDRGVPVCCLTLMAAEWEGLAAWQLRGMATALEFQGLGVGRRLFYHAISEARRRNPEWPMWCNARVSAIGFYERVGWEVVSEEFEIPSAGPHVKMVYRGE